MATEEFEIAWNSCQLSEKKVNAKKPGHLENKHYIFHRLVVDSVQVRHLMFQNCFSLCCFAILMETLMTVQQGCFSFINLSMNTVGYLESGEM